MLEKHGYQYQMDYPLSKNNFCCCDRINSHVIGADGSIYKCWSDIGIEECAIGNINMRQQLNYSAAYLEYLLYDPTEDEECKKCIYLPVCLSGCPHQRKRKKHEICRSSI